MWLSLVMILQIVHFAEVIIALIVMRNCVVKIVVNVRIVFIYMNLMIAFIVMNVKIEMIFYYKMHKAHLSNLPKEILIEIICTIGADKDKKYDKLKKKFDIISEIITEHGFNLLECHICKIFILITPDGISYGYGTFYCSSCQTHYHDDCIERCERCDYCAYCTSISYDESLCNDCK
jgi:hypothetical protein